MSVPPDLLAIEEEDAGRPAIEALLRDLSEPELRALWARTRTAAAGARVAGDMMRLFPLVRGTKTIQRIAGERGHPDRRATAARLSLVQDAQGRIFFMRAEKRWRACSWRTTSSPVTQLSWITRRGPTNG